MYFNEENINEDIMYALKDLIDNIPYAVWIKGGDGEYRYLNKRAAMNFGMVPSDLLGKKDIEVFDKDKAEVLLKLDRELLKSGKNIYQRKPHITNMEKRIYEIINMIIEDHNDSNIKLIGGIGKDITLNENLDKEIERSTLNLLDDSTEEIKSELPYILKDIFKCNGITIFILNEQKTKLKVFSKTYDDSIMPKDFSIEVTDEIKKLYIKSNDYTSFYDSEYCGFDGKEYIKTYFIHFESEFIGILNIHYKDKNSFSEIQQDITSKTCDRLGVIIKNRILTNKYKEELKKREETEYKLKIFLENSIDFYAIVKDGKLYFEDENNKRKIEKFLGYDINEVERRKSIGQLHHPDDIEKLESIIQTAKLCRKVEGVVIRYRCGDNQYKSVEWNITYVEGEDKFFISGKDVTEKLKLKSEKIKLRQEKRELEKAIELESLKIEFFANMSHEFKTPLNIILTAVQVLLGNTTDANNNYDFKKLDKYLRGIKQNSYRLLKIVNNIMDINKIDSGCYNLEIGNYNIVSVVEDIVMSVVSYMKDNKRNIIFDTVEEEIILACDPVKIERIILNLLSNALKYTYENGNIEVLIDKDKENNEVIISVINDGDPISDEDKERIFDRFTQSEELFRRRNEGTGIGLFLVKLLVEMHGGRIYVENNEDLGVKFVIRLPIVITDNADTNSVHNKEIVSKVEVCDIEFSDIYSTDTTLRENFNKLNDFD